MFTLQASPHIQTSHLPRDQIFKYLELEFHGLHGGGGLDAPGPVSLGDLHHRGGECGRLPQQHANVQSLIGII